MRKRINKTVHLNLFGEPIEEAPRPTGNEIMPLDFESHAVRMVIIKGQPWWVAADVCRAMSLENTSRAISRLDDDEKGVTESNTLGGTQSMAIVNEPGLYHLILTSNKPEAKRFKRWLTHEVLPSIRRTGTYAVPNQTRVAKIMKRLKCDDETANRRIEVIETNKAAHARLASRGASQRDFAAWNNATYRGQTSKNAAELRTTLEIKKNATPLDHMSSFMLAQHHYIKSLANEMIISEAEAVPIAAQCDLVEKLAGEIARTDMKRIGENIFLGIENDPRRGKVLGHVRLQLTA